MPVPKYHIALYTESTFKKSCKRKDKKSAEAAAQALLRKAGLDSFCRIDYPNGLQKNVVLNYR